MSKVVKIVLAVSLLLNVGLAGMAGSFVYKKHQHKKYMESVRGGSPEANDEVRTKMREHFRGSRDEIKQSFQESRVAHKSLIDTLTADEFDHAAFEKAAQDFVDSQQSMMTLKIKMIGDIAEGLSSEDRKAMARGLAGMLMQKKPHKKRGDYKNRGGVDSPPHMGGNPMSVDREQMRERIKQRMIERQADDQTMPPAE